MTKGARDMLCVFVGTGLGGGIVADSDPEAEYAECVAKAQGMLTALRRSTAEATVSSA
jgi:anthranilate/para-aminobenzoate synthase component I